MWTETAGPERGRHRTRLLSLGKEKRALEREGGFFCSGQAETEAPPPGRSSSADGQAGGGVGRGALRPAESDADGGCVGLEHFTLDT